AIRRRRGSAASFLPPGAGGLPFCSGGNLRTGSAITLFLSGRIHGWVLHGVADVFLDGLQLRQQTVGVSRGDAVERGGGEFRAEASELAEQRARRLLQVQPVDAAVVLVAAAL